MVSPDYDTSGIECYRIPSFKFHSGTTLPVSVAYRSFNPSASRTILIPTCYGGLINEERNPLTGPLADRHVVIVAMLGNGESSSPSNTAKFPELVYQDVVDSQHELLTKGLGIKELEAVIGFSMGGQQAYYWACMYPDFVKSVVSICSSARTSDHNYAFLEGPKSALVNSVDYADGTYREKGINPKRGLAAFGRAYCAWLWSAAWFRAKLWKQLSGCETMEEYMDTSGQSAFLDWDPEDLLVHLRMWQKGDVGSLRADGSFEKALEDIKCKVLVMPSRTDQYFPPEDSEIEMKYLKKGELAVIESIWGHPAGAGIHPPDLTFMDKKISEFLA